jgi:hypothetical protein
MQAKPAHSRAQVKEICGLESVSRPRRSQVGIEADNLRLIGNDPRQVLHTFRLTGATMMSRSKASTNLRMRRSVPRVL